MAGDHRVPSPCVILYNKHDRLLLYLICSHVVLNPPEISLRNFHSIHYVCQAVFSHGVLYVTKWMDSAFSDSHSKAFHEWVLKCEDGLTLWAHFNEFLSVLEGLLCTDAQSLHSKSFQSVHLRVLRMALTCASLGTLNSPNLQVRII